MKQPKKIELLKPFLVFIGFMGILLFCMAGESIIDFLLKFIYDI